MPPEKVASPLSAASGCWEVATVSGCCSAGVVVCREVARGLAMVVCVCRASSAARCRRSNSACWSAGSRGGEGEGWKVEERRVEEGGRRRWGRIPRMVRERSRDIVLGFDCAV